MADVFGSIDVTLQDIPDSPIEDGSVGSMVLGPNGNYAKMNANGNSTDLSGFQESDFELQSRNVPNVSYDNLDDFRENDFDNNNDVGNVSLDDVNDFLEVESTIPDIRDIPAFDDVDILKDDIADITEEDLDDILGITASEEVHFVDDQAQLVFPALNPTASMRRNGRSFGTKLIVQSIQPPASTLSTPVTLNFSLEEESGREELEKVRMRKKRRISDMMEKKGVYDDVKIPRKRKHAGGDKKLSTIKSDFQNLTVLGRAFYSEDEILEVCKGYFTRTIDGKKMLKEMIETVNKEEKVNKVDHQNYVQAKRLAGTTSTSTLKEISYYNEENKNALPSMRQYKLFNGAFDRALERMFDICTVRRFVPTKRRVENKHSLIVSTCFIGNTPLVVEIMKEKFFPGECNEVLFKEFFDGMSRDFKARLPGGATALSIGPVTKKIKYQSKEWLVRLALSDGSEEEFMEEDEIVKFVEKFNTTDLYGYKSSFSIGSHATTTSNDYTKIHPISSANVPDGTPGTFKKKVLYTFDWKAYESVMKKMKDEEFNVVLGKIKLFLYLFLCVIGPQTDEALAKDLRKVGLNSRVNLNFDMYMNIRKTYIQKCGKKPPVINHIPHDLNEILRVFCVEQRYWYHFHELLKDCEPEEDDCNCPLDFSQKNLLELKTLFPFLCVWRKWTRTTPFLLGIKVENIVFPEILHLIEREVEGLLKILCDCNEKLELLSKEIDKWGTHYHNICKYKDAMSMCRKMKLHIKGTKLKIVTDERDKTNQQKKIGQLQYKHCIIIMIFWERCFDLVLKWNEENKRKSTQMRRTYTPAVNMVSIKELFVCQHRYMFEFLLLDRVPFLNMANNAEDMFWKLVEKRNKLYSNLNVFKKYPSAAAHILDVYSRIGLAPKQIMAQAVEGGNFTCKDIMRKKSTGNVMSNDLEQVLLRDTHKLVAKIPTFISLVNYFKKEMTQKDNNLPRGIDCFHYRRIIVELVKKFNKFFRRSSVTLKDAYRKDLTDIWKQWMIEHNVSYVNMHSEFFFSDLNLGGLSRKIWRTLKKLTVFKDVLDEEINSFVDNDDVVERMDDLEDLVKNKSLSPEEIVTAGHNYKFRVLTELKGSVNLELKRWKSSLEKNFKPIEQNKSRISQSRRTDIINSVKLIRDGDLLRKRRSEGNQSQISQPVRNQSQLLGQGRNQSQLLGQRRNQSQYLGQRRNQSQLFGQRRNQSQLFGQRRNQSQLLGQRRNQSQLLGQRRNQSQYLGQRRNQSQLFGQRRNQSQLGPIMNPSQFVRRMVITPKVPNLRIQPPPPGSARKELYRFNQKIRKSGGNTLLM